MNISPVEQNFLLQDYLFDSSQTLPRLRAIVCFLQKMLLEKLQQVIQGCRRGDLPIANVLNLPAPILFFGLLLPYFYDENAYHSFLHGLACLCAFQRFY
jgi:hypothetical protein